jgi:hypothetical protein
MPRRGTTADEQNPANNPVTESEQRRVCWVKPMLARWCGAHLAASRGNRARARLTGWVGRAVLMGWRDRLGPVWLPNFFSFSFIIYALLPSIQTRLKSLFWISDSKCQKLILLGIETLLFKIILFCSFPYYLFMGGMNSSTKSPFLFSIWFSYILWGPKFKLWHFIKMFHHIFIRIKCI